MSRMLDKLKERWGVETPWQVIVILVIFSITGMTALWVRRFVFNLLEFGPETPFWLRTLTWLFTVVPSYQLLFLFYGFILGQFDFVWRFEKKTFGRIKGLFSRLTQANKGSVDRP